MVPLWPLLLGSFFACACGDSLLYYYFPHQNTLPTYLKDTFTQSRRFNPLPARIDFLTGPAAYHACHWCAALVQDLSINVTLLDSLNHDDVRRNSSSRLRTDF